MDETKSNQYDYSLSVAFFSEFVTLLGQRADEIPDANGFVGFSINISRVQFPRLFLILII